MKIKGITFSKHPILGDLELDFDIDGEASSAIYIAGENGTGKTTILNSIFKLSNLQPNQAESDFSTAYLIELTEKEVKILSSHQEFRVPDSSSIDSTIKLTIGGSGRKGWAGIKLLVYVDGVERALPGHIVADENVKQIFKIRFSDVAIDFTPRNITSVTAKNLDELGASQKTNNNLATEITQLLIDIQALDDADLSNWVRENPNSIVENGILDRRISRFRKAFAEMFPSKRYENIRNVQGNKQVVFTDNGKECFIGDLSSGEKQIVFRGGFFLKDAGAAAGAIGVIDEPEISLHPDWQLKIMSFYKSILGVDQNQSQVIVATHSPFIVQNYDKSYEKVIILKKAADGGIQVEKHPKFYGWTHEELVKTAFSIDLTGQKTSPLILVEGETDEKYLCEAASQLGEGLDGAEIKWVGRIGDKGDAEFTGDKALNHTLAFAKSNPSALRRPLILLYDSDTNKPETDIDNIAVRVMPFKSGRLIKKGIENLLSLPNDFDSMEFASSKEKIDDYGVRNTIRTLNKSKLCDYLIEQIRLGKNEQLFVDFEEVFSILRAAIGRLSG